MAGIKKKQIALAFWLKQAGDGRNKKKKMRLMSTIFPSLRHERFVTGSCLSAAVAVFLGFFPPRCDRGRTHVGIIYTVLLLLSYYYSTTTTILLLL